MYSGPLRHVVPGRLVHLRVGNHVGDGESTTRTKHAESFAEDPGLVTGQVDHAIGDDHVDRRVRKRDPLDLSSEELDVLDPGLALVSPGQFEHLVGHVQPKSLAARADPPSREQDVYAPARAEVENGLSRLELGYRGRVSTAERSHLRRLGQLRSVVVPVEARPEDGSLLGVITASWLQQEASRPAASTAAAA